MPSPREVRAGAAYIELYVNNNRLVRGLKRAQRRLRRFTSRNKDRGTTSDIIKCKRCNADGV